MPHRYGGRTKLPNLNLLDMHIQVIKGWKTDQLRKLKEIPRAEEQKGVHGVTTVE